MKSLPLASQVVTFMKQATKHIKLIIYLHTQKGVIIFQRLAGWNCHTPPLCPPCLKWTSMPWWLWWNFISRVRADCILLSALGIYFEPKGGVNLNNRSLEGGYLGVQVRHLGPSVPGAERVQRGHERPSTAFLHPSLCPGSFRRSQLSTPFHTWQYAHRHTYDCSQVRLGFPYILWHVVHIHEDTHSQVNTILHGYHHVASPSI